MNEAASAPEMSVVIVTPDRFDTIRATFERLAAQTARARLEVVVVAPSRQELSLDPGLEAPFGAVRVVEAGRIAAIGTANAMGVRAASAPVVVLAEDHCFPDPDWAESLIRAHAGPWSAVGPVVRNANPSTAVSWADLFIGYGPWLEPAPGGDAEFLPGHNTSYKRDVLLGFGDRLEALMGAETLLHWELRAAGHRLRLEPAARVAHTNFSLWSSWIPVQFLNGRVFAGARIAGMPLHKRLAFVLGSPAIPFLRLGRLARSAPAALRGRFLRTLPALLAGLLLDGAGQFTGYLAGPGSAPARLASWEFHRIRHITVRDRREVFGA